ncbi:MAG: hypothetical protein ACP5ER_04380 [Candidatus Bathyarchaeales archaeon]
MRETQKKTTKTSVNTVKLLGMQLSCKLLKGAYDALWTLRLLKTSIFITRTPLTTLKSLSKAVMN